MVLGLLVFLIAFIFSMFGLGGGLFFMPIFLLFCQSPQEASLLSFLCILITASTSAWRFYQAGKVDLRLVCYLGLPLSVTIIVSGMVAHRATDLFLTFILGVVLFVAGLFLALPANRATSLGPVCGWLQKRFPHRDFAFHPLVLSPVAAGIGFLCGLAGVAGGVFEVPLMTGLLGVPSTIAAGSSAVAVFLSGLTGALSRSSVFIVSHALRGWSVLGIMVCALLGALLGPQVSLSMPKETFKRWCGFFIMSIGLYHMIIVMIGR